MSKKLDVTKPLQIRWGPSGKIFPAQFLSVSGLSTDVFSISMTSEEPIVVSRNRDTGQIRLLMGVPVDAEITNKPTIIWERWLLKVSLPGKPGCDAHVHDYSVKMLSEQDFRNNTAAKSLTHVFLTADGTLGHEVVYSK